MAKEEKKSLVKQFLVNLLLGANLFTLVLLWVCCATTWLDPSLHPNAGVVGLAFPVFVILNLLFIPLWLLFKARMIIVPILGMALCGRYILDYCPINLSSEKDGDIHVLTWNTHNIQFYMPDSVEYATSYIADSNSDIICLQEYNFGNDRYKNLHERMEAAGYSLLHVSSQTIMSRFPVLNEKHIGLESSSPNTVLMADVQLPAGDTLTVFCVHLESNQLSPDDKDQYGQVLRERQGEQIKDEAHYLQGKLSEAARMRGAQANRLVQCIDSLPASRTVLLCGDFNDTPISYTYQHINRRLKSAFRQGGRGIGISFSERLFPVRIDHIFHSADYRCTAAHIDHYMRASDHYPLRVTLQKSEK